MLNLLRRPTCHDKDKSTNRRAIPIYIPIAAAVFSITVGYFLLAYNVCGWNGVLMGKMFLWAWVSGSCV
jgi:hypothetical protein